MFQEEAEMQMLTFGRVVSKHSVNYDADFPIREPSLGPEPLLCVDGRGRHAKERGQTDE